MYKIQRGSVIREQGYGCYVESTIITDVEVLDNGQQKFVSETKEGYTVSYLVGGTYAPAIEVLSYCKDCDDTGLFYQMEGVCCHCQE